MINFFDPDSRSFVEWFRDGQSRGCHGEKVALQQHTGHKASPGGLILLAAFAQGSARAEDDDDKTSIWNLESGCSFAKRLGSPDLSGANLDGVHLNRTTLGNANLQEVHLDGNLNLALPIGASTAFYATSSIRRKLRKLCKSTTASNSRARRSTKPLCAILLAAHSSPSSATGPSIPGPDWMPITPKRGVLSHDPALGRIQHVHYIENVGLDGRPKLLIQLWGAPAPLGFEQLQTSFITRPVPLLE